MMYSVFIKLTLRINLLPSKKEIIFQGALSLFTTFLTHYDPSISISYTILILTAFLKVILNSVFTR